MFFSFWAKSIAEAKKKSVKSDAFFIKKILKIQLINIVIQELVAEKY